MSYPDVVPGYCWCGSWVGFWKKTDAVNGQVKGQPKRFVRGHNSKLERKSRPDYVVEDRGFDTPCWVWQKSTVSPFNTCTESWRVIVGQISAWHVECR
jgi:hypothetical protein